MPARKQHGWASFANEKILWGGYSWINISVVICCICTSIYVLQLVMAEGQNCSSLEGISSVLNSMPLPSKETVFAPDENITKLSPVQTAPPAQIEETVHPLDDKATNPSHAISKTKTSLSRIVFGIGAAAKSWNWRKKYIKLWWSRNQGARGFVWLDTAVDDMVGGSDLPTLRVSGDTSNFDYKHKGGNRAAIRISRIVSETFRLGLPDVDWFVMGDDDTFYFSDNLVKVLSKYDHSQMFYIGNPSESHAQNLLYSYNMAFGGGGFAISYPLAKELASMQDDCLVRYPQLYGSDDRMHACMAELGVSLTKEPGFHQMDINGNPFGLLAAHPLLPLVSIHHLDVIKPIFPNSKDQVEALAHLAEAAKVDQASLLQQSICYHNKIGEIWSISVSWGYAVEVYKEYITPRELEVPVRTFHSCRHKTDKSEFPFNTRELPGNICEQSTVYHMNWVRETHVAGGLIDGLFESEYTKEDNWKKQRRCSEKIKPLDSVQRIRVTKEPVPDSWFQAPRRACCKRIEWRTDEIRLHLGACKVGEGVSRILP